jgi:hypothetical protein
VFSVPFKLTEDQIMSRIDANPCSFFRPEAVEWLWQPLLARGKLTLLDGDPAAGKTFFALDLAARLSRGGPLPDGQKLDRPYSTLFLSAEDDAADTLRPRAEAAGADLSRLFIAAPGRDADAPLPQLPDDIPDIERLVRKHDVTLVVMDPLSAFLPAAVSSNSDPSVRRVLSPLAAMAARTRCAMELVRHLSKYGGAKSLYRGLGSIGIAGAIRTGLLIARHPDDPTLRVLAQTKTNIGPPAPTLGFRLVPNAAGVPAVEWVGPVDLTADELCATVEPVSKRPRERAIEWLRNELAGGPRKAAELIAAAAKAGIAEKTLLRAKKDLDIRSEQVGKAGSTEWLWSDPSVRNRSSSLSDLPPLTEVPQLPDLGLDDCLSIDEMMDRLRSRRVR